jgi:hypothetical protein
VGVGGEPVRRASTAVLWRHILQHGSTASRAQRANESRKEMNSGEASVFPPTESDLYQNSHAGQQDKGQLTGVAGRVDNG